MIQARQCWDRRRPRLLVTLHVPQSQPAGEDACGPSIGAPELFEGPTKGNHRLRSLKMKHEKNDI